MNYDNHNSSRKLTSTRKRGVRSALATVGVLFPETPDRNWRSTHPKSGTRPPRTRCFIVRRIWLNPNPGHGPAPASCYLRTPSIRFLPRMINRHFRELNRVLVSRCVYCWSASSCARPIENDYLDFGVNCIAYVSYCLFPNESGLSPSSKVPSKSEFGKTSIMIRSVTCRYLVYTDWYFRPSFTTYFGALCMYMFSFITCT